MKKEQKNRNAATLFEHDNLHVSGGTTEILSIEKSHPRLKYHSTASLIFFPIKVHNTVLDFRYQFAQSVYHHIRAEFKVTKINRNNQYWILYPTYIKFRLLSLLFQFTPVY